MPSNLPLNILVTGRFLVGVSTLIAPLAAAPFFGIPLNREAGLLGRLFGSRDLLLALGSLYDIGSLPSLVTAAPVASRTIIQLGMIVDAIDVISGAVEWFRGDLTDFGFVLGSGGAAVLVGLAVSALK